jgi:hypothetical protein
MFPDGVWNALIENAAEAGDAATSRPNRASGRRRMLRAYFLDA